MPDDPTYPAPIVRGVTYTEADLKRSKRKAKTRRFYGMDPASKDGHGCVVVIEVARDGRFIVKEIKWLKK